jgi:hypothetical protein
MKWFEPLQSSGLLYSVNSQTSEKGRLHFTLHQCTGFQTNHTLDINTIYNAKQQITQFLQQLHGLQIEFRGILVTPTGIALQGYPKNDLQVSALMTARKNLSTFLSSLDIPFHPPYINDICHATLFRWTSPPTEQQIQYIQNTIYSWKEAHIATFTPIEWCTGFGTLSMVQPIVKDILKISTPIYIAHRGLTNGPDHILENNLNQLLERTAKGLYSECDVWYINSKLYLGHDTPTTEIVFENIISSYLWIHAKNKESLEFLLQKRNHEGADLCIFWHTTEDYALTTSGELIVYPGKSLLEGSCFMMPENSNGILAPKIIHSICSDYNTVLLT